MGISVVSCHKKAKPYSNNTYLIIIMKSLVIFAVVIAVAVVKAHPGVHRSGGYSHSSSSHGSPHSSSSHSSSYGSTHSSSSYSSPHSSSSHKVHKGKRSAVPAKYGHSTPSYNCETVY